MMAALIAVLILITNLYYLLIEEQNVLGVSRRGWWWILMEAFLEDFQEKGPEWQKLWPVAERGGGRRHSSISEIHRLKGREMWKPLAGWRTSYCPAWRGGNWEGQGCDRRGAIGLCLAGVCVCSQSLSHVRLFATLWSVAHQTPVPMGFLGWESWNRLPFPPPADLPNPGIGPVSLALAGGFFTTEPPGKPIWPTTQVKW